MNGFSTFAAIAIFVIGAIFTLALIFLPLFVCGIYNRTREAAECLRRIERDVADSNRKLANIGENVFVASSSAEEIARRTMPE